MATASVLPKYIRIRTLIGNLRMLENTKVVKYNDTNFSINHTHEFVPDFDFEWCPSKEHFRVYIHVADRKFEKANTGYSICTVSNTLTAMDFCTMYRFLHANRANQKEAT